MRTLRDKIMRIKNSDRVRLVLRGFLMAVMLVLIFIYLLGKDFSSAPDFIYNQF